MEQIDFLVFTCHLFLRTSNTDVGVFLKQAFIIYIMILSYYNRQRSWYLAHTLTISTNKNSKMRAVGIFNSREC